MGRAKPYDSSSKSWNDILGKPLNIPMNQREYSWTDKEIKQYVSERFGAFSDYRPSLSGSNYILWFGPFIFLALILAIFFIRRRV